jgi:hypothetical protein
MKKRNKLLTTTAATALMLLGTVVGSPAAQASEAPALRAGCTHTVSQSGNSATARNNQSGCQVRVRAIWRPAGGTATVTTNWTVFQVGSATITTAPTLVSGEGGTTGTPCNPNVTLCAVSMPIVAN